jgi:DNA-binding transcriptional LysR family regulator
LGVALVQRCLTEDYLEAGKLVIPFTEVVHNDRGYYFCYPESLRRTDAVEAFSAWLVKHGEISDAT